MIRFVEKSLETIHIDEPQLVFGHNQSSDYPKDGLFLYGPYVQPSRRDIRLGVVGTVHGIDFFKKWCGSLMGPVAVPPSGPRDKKDRPHLSNFPGLQEAFGIRIDQGNLLAYPIETEDVTNNLSIQNHFEAVSKVVDLFVDRIKFHKKNEELEPDAWIIIVPEIIFEFCRPTMGARKKLNLTPGELLKRQKTRSDIPLLEGLVDLSSENVLDDAPDFHRQMKAKMLALGETSQLIRETTLAPMEFLNKAGYPSRGTQDPASVAWNLATGLFYKTQADPPWKIGNMRPGVCYVGLVFKLLPNNKENHACCAAQMFLSEGDGVVFRGANGPWMTDRKEFHLKKPAAKALIKTVLETYKSKFGKYPEELFIRGKTKFNDEEWEAFSEEAPAETTIIGVRIRSTQGEAKLFRDGDYPCLRGTAIILGDSDAYLWTTGYVPRMDTYVGPETPNPIFITILRTTNNKPDIKLVLKDILSLTKINYNACNFSDGLPVTIRFADKVGEVLVMGSAAGAEKQQFKYYI